MWRIFLSIGSTLALLLPNLPEVVAQEVTAEEELVQMLHEARPYHAVSPALFERLGSDLPDAGTAVKALADAAPGGAFDPRELEKLPVEDLGYSAKWHEVRYQVYGLNWDITGLHLVPENPLPNMPTMVFIHGGSSNWYEFFVDPLNNPGLGQYLAQKISVLLVNIPGNFRHGGWTEEALDQRVPPYLQDREVGDEELKIRNAVYTFRLVADGVKKLVEETTTGPVVINGHSTGGELTYMLETPDYLSDRTQRRVITWEGGSHAGTQAMQRTRGTIDRERWPPVTELRARPPEVDYTGSYLGPLNPVWDPDKSREAMAERWMGDLEFRRRAHFKQPLQDLERRGGYLPFRETLTREVRQVLEGNEFGVDPEEIISDLFAPMEAPLTGYRAIIRTMAGDDIAGRLSEEILAKNRTMQVVNELRQHNPDAEVRLLIFDVPMTHYGHIERPKQLAGGLLAALRWLMQQ
jgi:pimeloyl-ACP methyl ester carboxylesterase